MFQVSEIVSLVLALALMPMMYSAARNLDIAGKRAFVAGAFLMILSYIFTILEGAMWPDAFNFAEHLALAASALAFAVGATQLGTAERKAVSRR